MFDQELLNTYRKMTAEQKMDALQHILDMEVAPLDMVVAFFAILKPHRANAMAIKLKSIMNYDHHSANHASLEQGSQTS